MYNVAFCGGDCCVISVRGLSHTLPSISRLVVSPSQMLTVFVSIDLLNSVLVTRGRSLQILGVVRESPIVVSRLIRPRVMKAKNAWLFCAQLH